MGVLQGYSNPITRREIVQNVHICTKEHQRQDQIIKYNELHPKHLQFQMC